MQNYEKIIKDILSDRELNYIYSESRSENFRKKIQRNHPHGNKYYIALLVVDMLVLNHGV